MDFIFACLLAFLAIYLGSGLGTLMFIGEIGFTISPKLVIYCIFVIPCKAFLQPEKAHKIAYKYAWKNIAENDENNEE